MSEINWTKPLAYTGHTAQSEDHFVRSIECDRAFSRDTRNGNVWSARTRYRNGRD